MVIDAKTGAAVLLQGEMDDIRAGTVYVSGIVCPFASLRLFSFVLGTYRESEEDLIGSVFIDITTFFILECVPNVNLKNVTSNLCM